MRVLMIVENCSFLRDPRVSREAKALCSSGHQVTVVCPNEGRRPWHERLDEIWVYRFPPIDGGAHGLMGYLIEYAYATVVIMLLSLVVLVRDGFDVIHVANPPDTLLLATAIYKLINKRIIYDQHDLCPELYVAKFAKTQLWVFEILLWLERLSYRLADHIIVTNESYKQVAITRGGVAESKITVVRNGPDLTDIVSHKYPVAIVQRSKKMIVYSGIIGAQDGLDYLCRIVHHLRYKIGREDFQCVILGDGDAMRTVRALSHDLQLDECLQFTGWIDDRATYRRYLDGADICISPEPSNSYNDRSTFVKIMEYMAAGKPIVSFDLPETRITAQDAAVYVHGNDEIQFASQMARLMDDPVMRSEMGCRGQDRIRGSLAWQYSIPGLAAAYEGCFRLRGALSRIAEQ
jgi:glycosyltransferase involved in cell wall biosynthesis